MPTETQIKNSLKVYSSALTRPEKDLGYWLLRHNLYRCEIAPVYARPEELLVHIREWICNVEPSALGRLETLLRLLDDVELDNERYTEVSEAGTTVPTCPLGWYVQLGINPEWELRKDACGAFVPFNAEGQLSFDVSEVLLHFGISEMQAAELFGPDEGRRKACDVAGMVKNLRDGVPNVSLRALPPAFQTELREYLATKGEREEAIEEKARKMLRDVAHDMEALARVGINVRHPWFDGSPSPASRLRSIADRSEPFSRTMLRDAFRAQENFQDYAAERLRQSKDELDALSEL